MNNTLLFKILSFPFWYANNASTAIVTYILLIWKTIGLLSNISLTFRCTSNASPLLQFGQLGSIQEIKLYFIWFSFYMCSLIKILYLHTFIICHVCMIVSCRWHNVLPIAEDKYIVNLDLTFSEQNSCCLKAWHAHEIDRSSERLRDFIPIFISLVRRVQ